jgi:hypothetical protein
MSHRSARAMPCCLRTEPGSSASGSIFFRGHLWVYFRYGPVTRSPSLRWLCQSASSTLLSSADAAQAKGLLTFYPCRSTSYPTEHVYLFWSHWSAKIRFNGFQPNVTLLHCVEILGNHGRNNNSPATGFAVSVTRSSKTIPTVQRVFFTSGLVGAPRACRDTTTRLKTTWRSARMW